MAQVLIIDDDLMLADVLGRRLTRLGHTAVHEPTLQGGIDLAQAEPFDVVFLDVHMPDGNGLDAINRLRAGPGQPEVLIITGRGDPNAAELAINSGAWNYVEKGASLEAMTLPMQRALQYRHERRRHVATHAVSREGIIGESPQIRRCLESVSDAAPMDASVLLSGESGTGKELFARAIHANSRRAGGPFIVVDCAAIPETLAEAILFGHEKGAYTGAHLARRGLVREADGGTIFLDEVGELPFAIQRAFLRVLQERRYRPIGSTAEVPSNFRVVAATNRDLDAMVDTGEFRRDLLYRLGGVRIDLPALRERSGDVRAIALHVLPGLSARYGLAPRHYAPDFLEALEAYPWPGNVRELLQVLEQAVVGARYEDRVYPHHLPRAIRAKIAGAAIAANDRDLGTGPNPPAGAGETLPCLREVREVAVGQAEREYLQRLLQATDGDIDHACRIADLSRSRFYALLRKYDVK